MALAAGVTAYLLRFGVDGAVSLRHIVLTALLPAVWLLLLVCLRAYELRFLHLGSDELRRVLHAGIGLAIAGSVASYALKLELARGYLLALVVLTTVATLAGRSVLRTVLVRQRLRGAGWMRRVVVAGHSSDVTRVVRELGRSRAEGFEVVSVCLADPAGDSYYAVPAVAGLDRVAEVAARERADSVVVVPCRHFGPSQVRRLGWQLERSGAHLLVASGLLDVGPQRTTITPVGSLALLHVHPAELAGARRVVKGLFDRGTALLALTLLSPLIAVLLVAIRLESAGPAIFRQERVGRNDRRFTMFKLRTMCVDAEQRRADLLDLNESDGEMFKMRHDPRITRLGKTLRRFSLDELPQLVNVVRGEMSLVGPRPPLAAEVDRYEDDVRRRLAVKPGLTGLWQISGPVRPLLGRDGPAGPAVRRQLVVGPGPEDPLADQPGSALPLRRLLTRDQCPAQNAAWGPAVADIRRVRTPESCRVVLSAPLHSCRVGASAPLAPCRVARPRCCELVRFRAHAWWGRNRCVRNRVSSAAQSARPLCR